MSSEKVVVGGRVPTSYRDHLTTKYGSASVGINEIIRKDMESRLQTVNTPTLTVVNQTPASCPAADYKAAQSDVPPPWGIIAIVGVIGLVAGYILSQVKRLQTVNAPFPRY